MTDAERRLGCRIELPPGWDSWFDAEARQLGANAPPSAVPPGAFLDQLRVRREPAGGAGGVEEVVDRVLEGDEASPDLEHFLVLDRGPCELAGRSGEHVLAHAHLTGPFAIVLERWFVLAGQDAWTVTGVTPPLVYAVTGPPIEWAALTLSLAP